MNYTVGPLLLSLLLSLPCQAGEGKYLFILSGQSNMQGMDQRLTFIPTVEREYGAKNVVIVKEAIGGRPIRMWLHDWEAAPGWTVDPAIPGTKPPTKEENGIMYQSMMTRVREATSGTSLKAVAFCWMQGERDARERHAAVYEQSLKKLFAQVKADFEGVPVVFVIGRLSDFGKGNKQPFYPEWEEVIQAQKNVARDTPNCTIISTDDLNTGPSKPNWKTEKVSQYIDDLHMSADGYRVLGQRFAEASIQLLRESPSPDTGLAPEVTDLNAEDVSYQLEHGLPYLAEPFLDVTPQERKDGIAVGELGRDGGDRDIVLEFARGLARESKDPKSGKTDSLLIAHKGRLIFESYFRRGRVNYPHYQMSITKSYTAMAIGRAIQLGHLTIDDLDKPAISFLNDLKAETLAKGADGITLHQAMHMTSGIRLDKETVSVLRKAPEKLKGQGHIQAYLQHSDPIPPAPREFKYQASDPVITMQVLEAVVPGSAKDFIRNELWGRLGVSNYHWQADLSGLPKSAAGSSFRSRDMLKMGLLVLNKGKWQGEQLIPADFVERATSPIRKTYGKSSYGYFWWTEDYEIDGKTYHCKQGRGAGGQFIFMFPELDVIAVVTAHNKGMGNMLQSLPHKLIPAFVGE